MPDYEQEFKANSAEELAKALCQDRTFADWDWKTLINYIGEIKENNVTEQKELEIGRIEKNDRVKTLVRINEFKGEKYVDIRDYTTGSNNAVYPTKKGVATPVRFVGELVTLLEKAEREVQGE